ncbi:phosphoenolpyruvate--protein phosphotransferase [Inhella gelatinilytica]|uniref:Phosphoenolpyruvate-protein phosphotransferase n=1 Tax=Inhella gelatinilytica TaxID=2795030 RepID=A0A931J0E5_9BURK|nr:phosphoenolpyruvate--protein phosphotransferase [Inhella gelatinilytica]MBH9553888.1 phosphoenolpyruvate--protein phosphotransferase [Inhella gelatinilytica]
MSFQVFGTAVARGVAIGRAVLVASSRLDVAHYFIADVDVGEQSERLRTARERVASELVQLRDALPSDAPPELAALLDVHLMLVHDEALVEASLEWVRSRHYNAEWALSAQLEVLARQFDDMEDDYLRERKADLEQVVERILRVLTEGTEEWPSALQSGARDFAGEDPLVLVAGDISPADMLRFRDGVFQGFVTDIGGKTSHTAIVARSMDIPAVVGTREGSRLIQQDDWVVIDGDAGVVVVNPSPIVLEEYRFRQRQAELERERLARLRFTPAVTLDGERVEMLANIELPQDAEPALQVGAEGVGLFRSEFLFMGRGGQLPSEEEQYLAYRQAVLAMGGRPVTIRTVDVGADKPLERALPNESRQDAILNPAMGLRAIRWSLSEPAMFRQQLRAIYRASAEGPVRLLLPMVSHGRELRQVRDCIEKVCAQLKSRGQRMGSVELGVMVEVPAAALVLRSLLPWVDFVSIGTNDLIQYTLAIDRADQSVSHLFDPWHPAVLGLLARVIQECREQNKSVSVCGEMAGDLAFTEVLLGMGLRSFSMHPTQIARVKQRVLRCDSARAAALVRDVINAEDPAAAAAAVGWGG